MKEQYELLEYSRSQIDKAGKIISRFEENTEEFKEYLPIVDNWRASHAYALDCISDEVNKVMADDEYSFVVHRLKRRESIIGKLKRNNNTGLYRMQDLGGCRVIVDDISKVYKSVERIKQHLIDCGHEILEKEYDYIAIPKNISGYRSYHIVVKFHCSEEPSYDGMLIEIQVRTKLEHIWATAVEMMDIITEETLKAGTGKTEYMRFFKLVSALFSIEEKTPIVEGVNNDKREIIEEIFEIDKTEHVRDKLASYHQAIQIINDNKDDDENFGYYLLKTNRIEKTISIIPFEKDNVELATKTYQDLEKSKKETGLDVVLISVNNLNILQEAYPNYFFMTYDFLSWLAYLCFKLPEKSKLALTSKGKGIRLKDIFSIKTNNPNVPSGIRVYSATLGAKKGYIYVIPPNNMTLSDSYLRFSAPIWDEKIDIEEDYTGEIEIVHQVVNGPGIIVTKRGGCYYCGEEKWKYVCSEETLIIQNSEHDTESLLRLLSWLKSSFFMWDLLWNYHSTTMFSTPVIEELWCPELSTKDSQKVIQITKEIMDLEMNFVATFEDEGFKSNKQIVSFNQNIAHLLRSAENIYSNYFGLSLKDKQIIQQELSIKGHYYYE